METVTINGRSYGPVTTISIGASPFTFTNPESVSVIVFISAGTVTDITFVHQDAVTTIAGGLLGGQYHLNPGCGIKVTYAVAPTMKYTPI